MRRGAGCAALAVVLALLAAPVANAQSNSSFCPGAPDATGIPKKPGPAIRFGITPQVQTGQLGTGEAPPRLPEDATQQLAALDRLRPANAPFVLRLHRFFWSDGEAGVNHFLDLTRFYTSHGYLVELQLRYHPDSSQEGDIPAWVAFVREVVDKFGPNPNVIGIQVTNEVNLTISKDSSDGGFKGSKDALIQGVIAAKDEARKRGFRQLGIGFNWAYRSDPSSESSFWSYLRDNGGKAFVSALDWVGLDAYPGTFFPPEEAPGREYDGMVNAFSSFRCYLESAAIPDSLPMHIEENGYPTGDTPDRSEDRQVTAMQAMIGAVQDFRGTYDISDYRWFDLRDSDSTSANFQQRYGLMHDDYSEKPAFVAYKDLVTRLSIKNGQSAPSQQSSGSQAKPVLQVRCARRGWLATVTGNVHAVIFRLGNRRPAFDRRAPFRKLLRPRRLRPGSRHVVRASVFFPGSGVVLHLRQRAKGCKWTSV